MCGIVGMFGGDCKFAYQDKREFFLQGLYVDALRGQESTGIALLPKDKKSPTVFKRALSGPDFVNRKEVLRIVGRLDSSYGIIGHNRSATRGDIEDENAHPFQYGHITLVHNGTVNNAEWLAGQVCKADSKVDSAQVAWAFSQEEPDILLPKMTGGFSLVWWDARDSTLHFARNHEKPMYWYTSQDNKMMYYGSELMMLNWLLSRNKLSFKNTALFTAPHFHYIFKDPNNTEAFEKRPFYEAKKQKGKHKYKHQPPVVVLPPKNTSPESTPKNSSTPLPTDIGVEIGSVTTFNRDNKAGGLQPDGKNHPVERETVSKSLAETIMAAGDSKNRMQDLIRLAEDVGVPTNKNIVIEPRKWLSYKSETKLGFMLGVHHSTRAIIQVFGVSMGDWNKYSIFGRVPVKIYNYRVSFNDTDNTIFVATLDKALFDSMFLKWQEKQGQIPFDPEDLIEIGTENPVHVTPKEFMELVDEGCYQCQGKILVQDADSVLWFGPEEKWPLCPTCSSNEHTVKQWQDASKASLVETTNEPTTVTKH